MRSQNAINPRIDTAYNQLSELVEGFLSSEKLVASRKQLPVLEKFKLNNSFIPSIRDLGSGYRSLAILWMARCSLSELSGLASFSSLKELYLANNEISDTSPIAFLENLEILDLEGNQISEIDMIEELAPCTKLLELTLEGNPVFGTGPCDDESSVSKIGMETKIREFRAFVWNIIPSLCVLDDEVLDCE
ncbi:Leucine-rich repeat-containing protein 56, partial [Physocladia obscura]